MHKRLVWVAVLALSLSPSAWALDAHAVRGGWESTQNGAPHILEFRIRGDVVSGVACTVCDDATTLAFVDGRLGSDALTFTITHVRDDGSTAWQDHASARLADGQLQVTGRSGAPGGGTFQWTLHKDPRGPAPPAPPGALRRRPPYLQAAAWERITPDRLVGAWLAGPGVNKQYFIIRRVGGTLRGIVCGPCDNPYTMAALEDFFIQNYTVLFTICHEDWGVGPLPYRHQVLAHIAKNEMRMDVTQDNIQRVVSMTLFGPLRFASTHPDADAGRRMTEQ
jgi:hypothetical protein